jgi:hypothetical protein
MLFTQQRDSFTVKRASSHVARILTQLSRLSRESFRYKRGGTSVPPAPWTLYLLDSTHSLPLHPCGCVSAVRVPPHRVLESRVIVTLTASQSKGRLVVRTKTHRAKIRPPHITKTTPLVSPFRGRFFYAARGISCFTPSCMPRASARGHGSGTKRPVGSRQLFVPFYRLPPHPWLRLTCSCLAVGREFTPHRACFFAPTHKNPCSAFSAVQAGKPMTIDGDLPLWPAPGLMRSAGFPFAVPELKSRSLHNDIFSLVPTRQGGFTGARAIRAMAHVVRQIKGCVGILEYLTPSSARTAKAEF